MNKKVLELRSACLDREMAGQVGNRAISFGSIEASPN